MNAGPSGPTNIDAYIAGFPAGVQNTLRIIRRAIRDAAPDAEETIKYQMPTYVLNGNLIHFAAYKAHVGVYPVPRASAEFQKELAAYGGEKSTLQLPLNTPVPVDLIRRIVKHNAARNRERAGSKGRAR